MAGASESKEGFQELPDPLTEWSDLFLLNLSKCIPSGDALTRAERGARELFESFKLTGPDVLRALRFAKLRDDTELSNIDSRLTVGQLKEHLLLPKAWVSGEVLRLVLRSQAHRASDRVRAYLSISRDEGVDGSHIMIQTLEPGQQKHSDVRRFVRMHHVTANHFTCSVTDTTGVPVGVGGLAIPLERKLCRILAPRALPRVYYLDSIPTFRVPLGDLHRLRCNLAARASTDVVGSGTYRPGMPAVTRLSQVALI